MATGIIEYGCKEPVIRRRHYRINCLWNMECQEESDKEELDMSDNWFLATTTDISGGGCRFNSIRQLNQDETIIIKIKNPDKNKKDELSFKAYLESIGDSIVCVTDEDVVKIHVHTNDPGLAIQRALTYGQLTMH